jgi:hypothetical protein
VTLSGRDLEGAWRLERWSFEYDDGRPSEYPLGTQARGLLLYLPDGALSATLMSTSPPPASLAYAGFWSVRDGAVHHAIEIATDPALVGMTTRRDVRLDGDRLVLTGADFRPGTGRHQQIVWRRRS